jgi:CheY-like chemotaxis protein
MTALDFFGRPARPDSNASKLQILVVEDEPDGAQTMATLLRLYGHDARVARNGHAALQDAEGDPPDVVLLDIGLPGLDGYEVARQIREQSRQKPPFLIAITGYGQEEDRRRSHEAGIDLHLLKPVDPEKLHELLDRFARVVLPSEGPA